jgi:hypothetical protein
MYTMYVQFQNNIYYETRIFLFLNLAKALTFHDVVYGLIINLLNLNMVKLLFLFDYIKLYSGCSNIPWSQ